MVDREKVIKGLENTAGYFRHLQSVGFFGDQPVYREHEENCNNALDLLKEQEPVKPTYEDFFGNRIARCGKCNGYIVRYKYCPGCGQAVKWE